MKGRNCEPILTDDGRVVGLLAETKLLQLLDQVFIHITHCQGLTLMKKKRKRNDHQLSNKQITNSPVLTVKKIFFLKKNK